MHKMKLSNLFKGVKLVLSAVFFLSAIFLFGICGLILDASLAGKALAKTDTAAKAPEKSIKDFPYHRVDFDLKGSKCVSCIRRVVRKVRNVKGVIKADISIKKPYSGVIIFEREKTDFHAIEKRFKSEKVEATNMETEDLKSVPDIVIPKSLMRKLKKSA